MSLSSKIFFGNSVEAWVTALIILLVAFIAVFIFRKIILERLRILSVKTFSTIDDFIIDIVEKSVIPLLYLSGFYFSIDLLTFPVAIKKAIHVAFLFAFTFFVLNMLTAVIRRSLFSVINKREQSGTRGKQARGLLIVINIVIWVLGIVFLIDNLGYDVTTLITGLGIGGIAIALAAQTILGDLFSYFIIFFDRPFEIGDFITVENKMGTVEYVGIKTTRLRTLDGEQLICSNTYLTNARVHNFKRMERRRVVFKLGVVYQTPVEKLKNIPGIVKSIIESRGGVRFDRGHFSGLGDFSLNFEFVYYVESSEYNVYMDRQQDIFFDVVSAFEGEEIEFAYPTQTLYLPQPDLRLADVTDTK